LKPTLKTSNNEAEYKALLGGIEICNALGVLRLVIGGESSKKQVRSSLSIYDSLLGQSKEEVLHVPKIQN